MRLLTLQDSLSSLHKFPEQWRYPELGAALRGLVIQGEPSSGCCHIIVPSSSNGGAKHRHQSIHRRTTWALPCSILDQTGVRNSVLHAKHLHSSLIFITSLHRLAIHSYTHFILIITVHVCHFMLSLYGGALSHLRG